MITIALLELNQKKIDYKRSVYSRFLVNEVYICLPIEMTYWAFGKT